MWRTIVEAGSCQDSDALVLERYCQLHDRRAVLLALVGTEGYVVPGVKQPSTAHPAIRLARDIEAQMTRLESVLASTQRLVPAWGSLPLGMTHLRTSSQEPEAQNTESPACPHRTPRPPAPEACRRLSGLPGTGNHRPGLLVVLLGLRSARPSPTGYAQETLS